MEVMEIEVFSTLVNACVMRAPGRHFPGVLIQGDTLASLCTVAELICRRLELLDHDEDLVGEAEELRDRLKSLLDHYSDTLIGHGMPLPYCSHP